MDEKPKQKTKHTYLEERKACLDQAKDLLQGAELLLKNNLHHLAYGFAALALEEIGKAQILGMIRVAELKGEIPSWMEKALLEHSKKLFFAIWDMRLSSQGMKKEEIETLRSFSAFIHEKRLKGSYVAIEESGIVLPRDQINPQETERLVSLTKARLAMGESITIETLSEDDETMVKWFIGLEEDPQNLSFVFGKKSMQKLEELKDGRAWVKWLQSSFEQAEQEAKELLERELERKKPDRKEAKKDKWKVTIKIQSDSHSIRPKELTWWNKTMGWIALRSGKTKKDIFVDFIFPKNVQIGEHLFYAGLRASQRFIAAINIGAMGFFWWQLPDHRSRYSERIVDIEAGKELGIERGSETKINWGNRTLTETDLRQTALCFGMLPSPKNTAFHAPFDHYLRGLAFLGKTDLHLHLQLNAFESFYNAPKVAARVYSDWDGKSDYFAFFEGIPTEWITDPKERRRYYDMVDIVLELNAVFSGGLFPAPQHRADGNCDGQVTPTDMVILLNRWYRDIPFSC